MDGSAKGMCSESVSGWKGEPEAGTSGRLMEDIAFMACAYSLANKDIVSAFALVIGTTIQRLTTIIAFY